MNNLTDGAGIAPKPLRVERQGALSEPLARRWPRIIGGVCEFCGIMDKNQPAEFQYKLCEHYRGLQAYCTYCDASKNPDEIVQHAEINVYEPLDDPGKLIMVCNSLTCSDKHLARFQKNR